MMLYWFGVGPLTLRFNIIFVSICVIMENEQRIEFVSYS
jgi:hypothetical protein